MSPPYVKRLPTTLKVSFMLSPRLPAKIDGSVELSQVNSPGSAQNSTILPCSTIIMHCPSATAMPEPFEMILSFPFVFEERPVILFCPFVYESFFRY